MAQEWFYKSETGEHGPCSPGELKRLAQLGSVTPETLLRKGREGNWVPAAKVKGLFATTSSDEAKPTENSPSTPSSSAKSLPPVRSTKPADEVSEPSGPSIQVGASETPISRAQKPSSPSQGKLLAIGGGAIGAIVLVVVILIAMNSGGGDDPTTKPGGFLPLAGAPDPTTPPSEPKPTEPPKPDPATPKTTVEIAAMAEPSVALIQGRFGSGTGFLIQKNVLATNKHVVEGEFMEDLEVHFPSATNLETRGPYTPKLLYKDPSCDLAFLEVKAPFPALTLIDEHQFQRGQEVLVIGNPGVGGDMVLENAISRGMVSTKATIDDQQYYQLDISINSGNSGGPVLDETGRVMGVVTLKAREQEGLGFCITPSQLKYTVSRLDDLSDTDKEGIAAQHRLRVIFELVATAGRLYLLGMDMYSDAMRAAMERGLSARKGLEVVQGSVTLKLREIDEFLTTDLEPQVQKLAIDPNIPENMRQQFVELWSNYKKLKSYVEEPRGTYTSYKETYHELRDTHGSLVMQLAMLLGVNLDH